MYSVFFKMSEIFANVMFGILERLLLKEKPFKEVAQYTIKADGGWMFTQTADKYFAEFRGRQLMFRPHFPILRDEETKGLVMRTEKVEPEKVYVTWKEVASDDFFKDVEQLFKIAQKSMERKRVSGKGG